MPSSTSAVPAATDLARQLPPQNFLPRGEGSRSKLVSVTAREHLQKIIVRTQDKQALASLAKTFACKMPQNNKTIATKDKPQGEIHGGLLLWMGPDELLFRSNESASPPSERIAELEKQLQQTFAAVVDVSDYYVVVRVSGARAKTVLQKNCPLDFDERVFQQGDCAQSLYGKAPVLVNRTTDDAFDMQVRISLASYLWDMLAFATRSEHS